MNIKKPKYKIGDIVITKAGGISPPDDNIGAIPYYEQSKIQKAIIYEGGGTEEKLIWRYKLYENNWVDEDEIISELK